MIFKNNFAFVRAQSDGIQLQLHIQPGSSRCEFAGTHGDALKLRISARPVEGAANAAVCAFLAEFFGLSKSSVSILKGETSRSKVIFLKGNPVELMERLNRIIVVQGT